MDDIGLQSPIVTVEEPKIIKPAGGFGRTMRKHGVKFLMGGLLTLLLGAGVWLEVNIVQQKQQVESQAKDISCAGHNHEGGDGGESECINDPDGDCIWRNGHCKDKNDYTPTMPACQSTSISSTTLSPGGSLTITSTATTADITGFSYAFYNRDYLYGPDNPKPICTGAGASSELCPNGGTHLVKGSTVAPTSTNTITVNYNDINVPDLSWEGQNPTKIQMLAFFGNSAGWSSNNPNCVEQFELTIPRPDYCVSASANKASMLPGETLTLSSVSNTPVNGFFWVAYNRDNVYGPGNAKPICTGAGDVTTECPNGGTQLIISDPNNKTDGTGLRTNGSAQITYGRLFLNDKSWNNQQVKNISIMAYFSLNGGQQSWPQDACKAFTKMGTAVSPSPNPTISCTDLTKDKTTPTMGDTVTFTCEANFNAVSPVAFFAHKIGVGNFTFDPTAYPINSTTKKANKQMTINQVGDWNVQCRVCTDSSQTTCTVWGQAN